jgi:stage III sporulation protein AD
MGIVQLSGVALLSAMLVFLLRNLKSDLALVTRAAALLLVCGGALALYLPLITRIEALFALADGAALATPLLRAVGIGLVAELCALFCRELGEGGLADGVVLFGKIEVLVLSLPLVDAVLEIAKELLSF